MTPPKLRRYMLMNIYPPLCLFISLFVIFPLKAAPSLIGLVPSELKGTHGAFDFISTDAVHRQLLLCHTDNGSFDVVNMDTSQFIKSIPLGDAQGVCIDDKGGRYFVSVSKPAKLVIVDSSTLAVTAEVALPDEADLSTYNPVLNRVYVCNGKKPQLWVIDPDQLKIVATISIPGGAGMEDLNVEPSGCHVYQALRGGSEVVEIDTAKNTISHRYSTQPVASPHGMVFVAKTGVQLIAGKSGLAGLMSLATGKIIASTAMAEKVDQIAYDAELQRAYAISSMGTIEVLNLSGQQLSCVDHIKTATGVHGIAVDSKTHAVWIAYGSKEPQSFVQKFIVKD